MITQPLLFSKRSAHTSLRPHFYTRFRESLFIAALTAVVLLTGGAAWGQTLYRSNVATGNWSNVGSWQVSTDNGANWGPAVATPNAANSDGISIRNGHNITFNSAATIDQTVIEVGGTVTQTNGLTVADGTGADLVVHGVLTRTNGSFTIDAGATMVVNGTFTRVSTGTITINGTITFNDGATYVHDMNGGTVPPATWHVNSNCHIIGNGYPNGMDQTFGNVAFIRATPNSFTMNANLTCMGNLSHSNSGTGEIRIAGGGMGDITFNVGGDFIMTSGTIAGATGARAVTLNITGDFNMSGGTFNLKTGNGSTALNVGGSFNQSGGTFTLRGNSNNTSVATIQSDFHLSGTAQFFMTSAGASTLNIEGDYTLDSGDATHNMSNGTLGNNSTGTMNVAGNFTHTAGTITETNTANGIIVFNGNGSPQTLISGGTGIISEVINFTVNNGAFLQMAEAGAFLGGAGTFALASGGTLGIRSEDGITSSGATGNVRVSGGRTFSTAANYVYNGTTAQSTGNGLPASCARLTVDNELDVALTNAVTINNQLILTDGHLALGNSNLSISPSASIIGASIDSYIRTNGTGILKRTVSTTPVQFPVGNSRYNPATLNRSTGSGVYNVKVRDAVLTGGTSGAPISDKVVNRSWDVTADGPVGTLTLTLQWNGADEGSGFSGLDCYVAHFNGVKWEGDVSGVASGIGPFTRSRSGITSLSPFAIGSLGVLPIELLYFKAEKQDDKTALLTWATATELNNDYMAVERSGDGQVWKEIGRVSGAGTTTVPQAYSLPDANPLPGLNYYRLRQVDYDGVFEYFNTVALNFPHVNLSPLTFDLFPNPAGDYITLRRSQNAASDGELFLMDMKGRLLQRRALSAGVLQEELDLSGLPTGMYLVRLTAGGQQEVMRFVKE